MCTEPGSSAIHVNGTRVFCRGPNYVSDQLQSNMTRAKYESDVRMMREANMNMVRVYCVVEREEFYDACDEQGILGLPGLPDAGPNEQLDHCTGTPVPAPGRS